MTNKSSDLKSDLESDYNQDILIIYPMVELALEIANGIFKTFLAITLILITILVIFIYLYYFFDLK